MIETTFETEDSSIYRRICGYKDNNVKKIEELLDVQIIPRGNILKISAEKKKNDQATRLLHLMSDYLKIKEATYEFEDFDLRYMADSILRGIKIKAEDISRLKITVKDTGKSVMPRTLNQARYISSIHKSPMTFAIGPAGTGKTYLAVVLAIYYLQIGQIDRIILTRPAVEAGENLGFLPGDLIQKLNPYLRPLYDALFELMSFEKVSKLMEKTVIEIAPLAYMRGRTLNNSFIILDEAQNTTISQMKMFLTRLGNNSKMVVSGDITQIDLEKPRHSGLTHAMKILKPVKDIGFVKFEKEDISRHPVVEKIVAAYEQSLQTE